MIEHPLFGNLIESEALLPMRTFAANAVRLQRSAACGVEEAGRAVGRQILMVKAANEREFSAAFYDPPGGRRRAGARSRWCALPQPTTTTRRAAARYALPASYLTRDYAEAGGLMSYGASQIDAYCRAGRICGSGGAGSNGRELHMDRWKALVDELRPYQDALERTHFRRSAPVRMFQHDRACFQSMVMGSRGVHWRHNL
jgi:hypothetical protein